MDGWNLRVIRSLVLSLLFAASAWPNSKRLAIRPVPQEKPAWCWLAVGQMVFEYFGEPNVNRIGDYQCGIIALFYLQCNPCSLCPYPSGTTEIFMTMLTMLIPMKVIRDSELISITCSDGKPITVGAKRRWLANPA